MKIAIVGSRDMVMPGTDVISSLIAIIMATPDTAEVAVRGPAGADKNNVFGVETTSPVEALAYRLAVTTSRRGEVYRPIVDSHGRAAVFERDYTLVDNASRVYAFFSPGGVMEGGTGHVVKAALDREIPVEAYTIDDDGHLVWVGSDDGRPGPLSPDELEALYLEHNRLRPT